MSVLAGRSVIVTGASSGIGKALALELSRRGARVALAARDAARLEEVAASCRSLGGQALVVPTDVTGIEDCRRMVEATVAAYGGLDVLVNNAGITMISSFEDVKDLTIFEQVMKVNYLGVVYPTSFALPHLRKSRGVLAQMASLTALTGVPTRTGYAASKHAVLGFSDSLRVELRGSGVAVTVICPDFVVSEIHDRAFKSDGTAHGRTPYDNRSFMTAEECARQSVEAIEQRKRLAVLSFRGWFGRFVKPFAPGLIDAIAARAVRRLN